jgi:hypothetical protein
MFHDADPRQCRQSAAMRAPIANLSLPQHAVEQGHMHIERISHILHIYHKLHTVFGSVPRADEWILRRDTHFWQSCAAYTIRKGIDGLAEVHRHLDERVACPNGFSEVESPPGDRLCQRSAFNCSGRAKGDRSREPRTRVRLTASDR